MYAPFEYYFEDELIRPKHFVPVVYNWKYYGNTQHRGKKTVYLADAKKIYELINFWNGDSARRKHKNIFIYWV